MKAAKVLTNKEKARLKKIEKLLIQNSEMLCVIRQEHEALRTEMALILCPFKIGDKVIRTDGLEGKVSKIKLAADKTPVISVFKRKEKPFCEGVYLSEHYRTKKTESWSLRA